MVAKHTSVVQLSYGLVMLWSRRSRSLPRASQLRAHRAQSCRPWPRRAKSLGAFIGHTIRSLEILCCHLLDCFMFHSTGIYCFIHYPFSKLGLLDFSANRVLLLIILPSPVLLPARNDRQEKQTKHTTPDSWSQSVP